jgi:hypothetical protein
VKGIIANQYLASKDKENKFWEISSIVNRFGYDIENQKVLMLNIFEFLKNSGAEVVSISAKDKESMKFYDCFVLERFIKQADLISELKEKFNRNNQVKGVQYFFDLKTFNKKPEKIIEEPIKNDDLEKNN